MATGPVHPTDYPLLHLARGAVHGHKMIAEAVREHAARAAAEHHTTRAVRAAQAELAAAAAEGVPPGGAHPDSGA